MFETELIAMPFPQASKALARFTVLDLTQVRAGPAGSILMTLARARRSRR